MDVTGKTEISSGVRGDSIVTQPIIEMNLLSQGWPRDS